MVDLKVEMAHSLLTLQVVVYKLLRLTGGLCILNKYSVNFVAGERDMGTVLPPVPLSFVLQS